MKVQTVSKTGAGASSPIVINTNVSPVNIGIGAVVTGVVDYTIQHSYDNPSAGLTTWFDHPTLSAETTNQFGSYTDPITAIRVNVNSGAGSVTVNIVQAGII